MSLLRALLANSIDYAGLFPPAQQSMADAVTAYARYYIGVDADLLGRFVVPATRLDEFSQVAASSLSRKEPWRLAVLLGKDLESDRERILEFNAGHTPNSDLGHAICDTVEVAGDTPARINEVCDLFPDFNTFIEIHSHSAESLAPLLAENGANAKIRTGGVTRDSFPPARDVSAFILACSQATVAFKATAGLHHPIRGEYRLTYESGSERAVMYGYLNVLLAAAAALRGAGLSAATDALLETDARTINVSETAIKWREQSLDDKGVTALRQFFVSFGSCSFDEPVGEARAMGLLQ